MPSVYLGLGSNTQPERHLRLGIQELATRFSVFVVSKVYRNAALGFSGDEFLNAVTGIETDKPVAMIANELREIHDLAGRSRDSKAFAARTLDIDLLLYGSEIMPQWRIPRPDVLEYSFVLRPLAEIAPDLRHPETGKSMLAHWEAFDAERHPLIEDSLILSNDRG